MKVIGKYLSSPAGRARRDCHPATEVRTVQDITVHRVMVSSVREGTEKQDDVPVPTTGEDRPLGEWSPRNRDGDRGQGLQFIDMIR